MNNGHSSARLSYLELAGSVSSILHCVQLKRLSDGVGRSTKAI